MDYIIDVIGGQWQQTKKDTTYVRDYRLSFTDLERQPDLNDSYVYSVFRDYVTSEAASYSGLGWSKISLKVDPSTFSSYIGTVTYSSSEPDRKVPRISGGVRMTNRHVRWSLAPVNFALRNGVAAADVPPPSCGLNWDPETRDFQGADIEYPEETFTIAVDLRANQFTDAFMTRLNAMVGSVNSEPFNRFGRGELRYSGMTYSSYEEKDPETDAIEKWWSCTFEFRVSPTVTLTYPDFPAIEKEGWHYASFFYTKVEDEYTQQCTENLDAIYINQVYPYADFSVFNF